MCREGNNVNTNGDPTKNIVMLTALKPQPHVFVESSKANDVIAFYKSAFGAEEVNRVNHSCRLGSRVARVGWLSYQQATDPSKDFRDSFDTPASLTNLGATCYANSILQFLYLNKSFGEGVLSLHASKMAFIDSAPFIEALALDNGIQQDSHEFLTLLFSLLEQCLSCSNISKARTVVQDLCRGGVSHVMK
ncbi:hypothetical protein E3N88_15086 [Mikania micrantha]|uniref:ubiquitinyl hydrolase 1 n=1 Tax=Mikania micrantha TaxID=192012 RepID=A0A5N6P5W3_9ASTR|nr:hypothetical protein E3N88_15086 [Mikania micrantha]